MLHLTALPEWADPRIWPWPVWAFIAVALLGNASSIWNWYRRHRAMGSWTTASARIELASFSPVSGLKKILTRRRDQAVTAELDYSYVVEGQHHRGTFERPFDNDEEAAEFVRGLEGQAVSIRFNPRNPSDSLLPDEEVENLVESRPPCLEAERALQAARQVPRWVKPLLWPFVLIAAVGLVLSISVHVAALFGKQLLLTSRMIALHIGIFVVWIPTVFVAQKTQRGKDWKSMFRDAPGWMSKMTAFFFVYALINFGLFIIQVQTYPHGDPPGPLQWRGFSGHWMVFYSAALSVLYSAASAPQDDSLNQSPSVGDRVGRPH